MNDAGFDVVEADEGGSGLELAAQRTPDVVLLDIRMPGLGGVEVLRRLQRLDAGLPVIVVTAHGTISGAVSAIRDGAFEYVTKPFRNEHLVETVQQAMARRSAVRCPSAGGIRDALTASMGQSPAIQALVAEVEAVASTDYSVVISGETGAGKEVVARCLHVHGPRANHPLVIIDCGAIAESLTDNEFFGHEKGAFTGAGDRRRGSFEAAGNGGTIFLDEVGNLAPTGQKALLRTLEDHTIHRVGGTEMIELDMRVIAATNDDLRDRAKSGSFREDLFFRLAEYVITVPPLRARTEDIPFLARRFLESARASLGRPSIDIHPAAFDLLRAHRWPGNVRELRNVMRRAALTTSDIITPDLLRVGGFGTNAPAVPPEPVSAGAASLGHRVRDQVRAVERDAVVGALEQAKGNKAEAARLLGIDYKTYRTKLKMLT
ncbi:MAG: sigma-54 dependent transcriptional regulator [Azospirillaceae bacterium]|nr:sigma-54 dependent transcriptional regulator [Azospirillaceae bacterium]